MEVIQAMAKEVLLNMLLAVASLLCAYGMYYIQAGIARIKIQTKQIKDEAGRKLLENALDDVARLASLSVGAVEQTTAKALREAVKNGTTDRKQLLTLGNQVFEEVKAAVTPEAQQVIVKNLGSFDDYLSKCIEDAVLKIKRDDPVFTLPEEVYYSGVDIGSGKDTTAFTNL